MKISKNILIGLMALTCFNINMPAFQRPHAIAVTAAAATGGAWFFGDKVYKWVKEDFYRRYYMPDTELPFNNGYAVLGALVVGGIVGLVAFGSTPTGLLRCAKGAFPKDPLLVDIVQSGNPLIPALEQYYLVNGTPLAESFVNLGKEYLACDEAVSYLDKLDKSLKSMSDDETKAILISESEAQRVLITTVKPLIAAALTVVKQQPLFLEEQRVASARAAAMAADRNATANSLNASSNMMNRNRY